MTISKIEFRSAVAMYLLKGPPGASLDMVVATLINAGMRLEVVVPTTTYRIDPRGHMVDKMNEGISSYPGFSCELELGPKNVISLSSTVQPARSFRRSFTVHGEGAAFSAVARAIDRHLTVSAAGVNRWSITGRTSELLEWAAVVHGAPVAEVMRKHGITAAMVKAEDEPPLPVSVVSLPDRVTTTQVVRDQAGEVREVLHLETNR